LAPSTTIRVRTLRARSAVSCLHRGGDQEILGTDQKSSSAMRSTRGQRLIPGPARAAWRAWRRRARARRHRAAASCAGDDPAPCCAKNSAAAAPRCRTPATRSRPLRPMPRRRAASRADVETPDRCPCCAELPPSAIGFRDHAGSRCGDVHGVGVHHPRQICSSLPTSGAGCPLSGPMTMLISLVYRRVSRSEFRRETRADRRATPPWPAERQVTRRLDRSSTAASAMTSS